MDHTELLDTDEALAPMLELAQQSSNDKNTVRTLVMKVLSSPTIFCGFDQIKASLKLSDDDVLSRTLDLFSYGTYRDFKMAEPSKYLSLTDSQVSKLRQLTVQSCAEKACLEGSAAVSYASLSEALDMEQVEDVIVSCIYARTIRGKLCQKTKTLILSSEEGPPIRSRDVPPSKTLALLEHLNAMSQRLEASLNKLDQQQDVVQSNKQAHDLFWRVNKPQDYSKDNANAKMSSPRVAMARDRPRATKRSRGGLAAGDGAGRI